ncbi:MAG: hypothetical protein JSU92_08425 [Deltaproteobacteria bacterium]|nr:MAG: hypothetical protein JSU92_08425 [Deltaproteobacteria bacterium]
MKKIVFISLVLALILSLSSATAIANEEYSPIDLSFDGYYRARWINQGLERYGGSKRFSYFQQRLRLEPKLQISEEAKAQLQVDLLDNVIWGDNTEEASFFSGTPSGYNNDGDESDYLVVKQAWGEAVTPLGLVRVGRQAANWGMGIYHNDGDGFDDDWGDNHWGDTVDRILVAVKYLDFYIIPIYDKVVEGPLHSASSTDNYLNGDVDEYIIGLLYKKEETRGGFYLVNRKQKRSTGANTWLYDLYGQYKLGPIKLEAEALIVNGDLSIDSELGGQGKVDISNMLGGAVKGDCPVGPTVLGLEAGFATGPSENESWGATPIIVNGTTKSLLVPTGTQLREFFFDPDYNVALILFEEYGNKDLNGRTAVSNAVYVKPTFRYSFQELFTALSSLTWAWAEKKVNYQGGKKANNLGIEVDLGVFGEIADMAEVGLQFGYLFPGDVFKDAEGDKKGAYALQLRFTTAF